VYLENEAMRQRSRAVEQCEAKIPDIAEFVRGTLAGCYTFPTRACSGPVESSGFVET
jgi:hypothetical protein